MYGEKWALQTHSRVSKSRKKEIGPLVPSLQRIERFGSKRDNLRFGTTTKGSTFCIGGEWVKSVMAEASPLLGESDRKNTGKRYTKVRIFGRNTGSNLEETRKERSR